MRDSAPILDIDAPPSAAEQALLGAWLTSPEAWDLSADLYVPGMFAGPFYNAIAEETARLYRAGKQADPILVAQGLPAAPDSESSPVSVTLALARAIGSSANVRYYAEQVRAAWSARQARGVLSEALNSEMAPTAMIEWVQGKLGAIEVGDGGQIRTMAEDAQEFMEALDAERSAKPGTEIRSTGFEEIDQITGGLETGLPHVMAARPGGGKSAYAVSVARYSAGVLKEPTALIWIEDTRRKAMLRIAAAEAGIPAVLLRHGRSVPREAWDRLAAAMDRVSRWPLFIESAKGMTPRQIAARMRRLTREKGVRRFLCDHLAEMNLGDEADRKVTQALGDALRTYRDALEATGSGGVMFHQLGREAEKGGAPTIAWLYNSDQVGQVARVIGFLAPEGRTMNVSFAKCTYGPPGTRVELGWDPATMAVFQPEARR